MPPINQRQNHMFYVNNLHIIPPTPVKLHGLAHIYSLHLFCNRWGQLSPCFTKEEKQMNKTAISIIAALFMLLTLIPSPALAARPWPSPTPTAPVSPVPTAEPTPVASPEPSAEPTPTASPEPTASPKPTDTPEPTASPESSVSPEPAATPRPSPTRTPRPTYRPIPTYRPRPTERPCLHEHVYCCNCKKCVLCGKCTCKVPCPQIVTPKTGDTGALCLIALALIGAAGVEVIKRKGGRNK